MTDDIGAADRRLKPMGPHAACDVPRATCRYTIPRVLYDVHHTTPPRSGQGVGPVPVLVQMWQVLCGCFEAVRCCCFALGLLFCFGLVVLLWACCFALVLLFCFWCVVLLSACCFA